MSKLKYIFVTLLFFVMAAVCYKAIEVNYTASEDYKPEKNSSTGVLTRIDTKNLSEDESTYSNETATQEVTDTSEDETISSETQSDNITKDTIEQKEEPISPTTEPAKESVVTETAAPVKETTVVSPTKKPDVVVSNNNKTSSTSGTQSSAKQEPVITAAPAPVVTPAPVTPAPVVTPVPTPRPTLAPIIIPDVYTPTTPGNSVLVSDNETAFIDKSNVSKGYVGVKYTGSNWKVKVVISANGEQYNYDLPSNGKYTIYPLQFGNGSYTVSVYENISGTSYSGLMSETFSVSLDNSKLVYLYPNQYVWFTQNSNVVYKSAEICRGLTSNVDKVAAIFQYVSSHISYDYSKAKSVQSGYLPDVDSILSSGKGICFDYAAVFAAMCRAQGIPCKLVTGYISDGQFHAWNEVYLDGTGKLSDSFTVNQTGYTRVDCTFYSSMSPSSAVSYIKNDSNYRTYHVY